MIALQNVKNKLVYKDYTNKRDLLDFNTFQISAHLNFGNISIREAYFILKHNITI